MYKPQLDGLRCFCFLGVFLAHCYLHDFWFGGFGVQVFFVMSGYLITRILMLSEQRPLARAFWVFYMRRALRVFPIYYLLIVILWFLGNISHIPWHLTYTFNLKAFILSSSPETLSELMKNWQTNGLHFWSLCVEEQFYIFFPIAFYLCPKDWRRTLILAGLAFTIACRITFANAFETAFYGAIPPVCGEYILWGCLFAHLDLNGALDRVPGRAAIYAAAVLFAAVVFNGRPEGSLVPQGPVFAQFRPVPQVSVFGYCAQTLYAISFSLLIWGLWKDDKNEVSRFLSFKPFAYLGKISYGLYLIHLTTWELAEPLQEHSTFLREGAPEWTYAILLIATIVLGSLSWHLYEKPCNSLKRFFSYRKKTEGDASGLPGRPE